jgi:cyclophilin family peptidyl-prolyl cis-trans isomerase
MVRALVLASIGLWMAGCASTPTATSAETVAGTPAAEQTKESEPSTPSPKPTAMEETQNPELPKDGDDVAILDTAQGKIVVRFFWDKAPKHVENFLNLAKKGFYDGTRFHRVIPGFMIQGGDPNSKSADKSRHGIGGPGYKIDAEFNDTKHVRGILSMARSSDPNSAGSQFFIVVADSPHLDHQYTAFGAVVSGMDVVDKIAALPTDQRDNPVDQKANLVKSIKVAKWPLKSEP